MVASISLPKTVCAELRVLVNALADAHGDNLNKIILFGSFAKGEYQPDSDLDLCLVLKTLPETNEEKLKIRDIAADCGIKRHVDVVVCTHEELRHGGLVFKYIRRDGVVLYE